MRAYVPLHLHSEYSLLDGSTRISSLIAHAKANEMPACAITDHGSMYAAVEFYRKAKEEGLKPIIGCEIYIVDGNIKEKNPARSHNNHLVLIAKNKEGYKNLVKLASIAQIDGFYYKPRINHKLLEEYHNGLICLSACLGGELSQYLLKNQFDKARELAGFYKNLFGEDYYIEIQDHGMPEQKED